MSRQPPPKPSTIFNSNNFTSTSNDGQGGIPIPTPSHFVEFPVAQGSNTLISTTINNSLTVDGLSTFNGLVDFTNASPPTLTATATLNNELTNLLTVNSLINSYVPSSIDVTQAPNTSINYSIPLINNYSTATYSLYATPFFYINPFLNLFSVPALNASQSITTPLFNTSPSGKINLRDSTNALSTSLEQVNYDLNMTMSPTGSLNMITQGTYALPVGTSLMAGTSVAWNASSGNGESVLINYQDSGGSGGFDFYNINSSNPITKIASIPRIEPLLTDASVNLASTKWVSDYVNSIPSTGLTLAEVHSSILPFTAIQTFNFDSIVSGITVGTGGGHSSKNVAVGLNALSSNVDGVNSVAIGSNSLSNLVGNLGEVLTITSTNAGGVYTGSTPYDNVPFNLIISGGGATVDAVATCNFTVVLGLGTYSSVITLVSGGLGYTGAPTITFPTPAGMVATNPATCSFTYSVVSGSYNTCVGGNSNLSQTQGDYNSSFGYNAGSNITTGSFNCCLGSGSQVPNISGDHQVVIGSSNDTVFLSGGLNISSSSNPTQFIGAVPQCPTSTASNLLEITNVQTVNNLISGMATLAGNPQTFIGQNIFDVYCPQSPIAPTVNDSLVNLLYLNTQLLSLRNTIPLKATMNISPISGDFTYSLTINSWADYLVNDFITLRYNLSNNYPFTNSTTASINTSNSCGYVDIYPSRLAFGTAPFGSVLNFNVINNTINGSNAYNMNSTLIRGRWFWAYNQSNTNAPVNGIYLFIQSVSGQQLNIGIYNTTPSTGNQYASSFNIELISSLDSSKISSSGFSISNF